MAVVDPTNASANMEPNSPVRPTTAMTRGPNLSNSMPLMGLRKMVHTAPGVMRMPVSNAVNPSTFCR